jgi:homocysteine S-methyltransferase
MARPLILDGGLATSLEERGHELHPRLWSAGVFIRDQHAVEDLHVAFLEAGAEILVSASYQMSFEGLAREGLDCGAAADAMRRTVDVARRARERAGRREARIAASVGPYGAVRCDGSEYRGDYGLTVEQLIGFHSKRFAVLAESGADLLAIETVPSIDEARALLGLLAERDGLPAWVSFSCKDGTRISDGHEIRQAAELCDGCVRVEAIGVNCTAPQHVSQLMDEIRRGSAKPIVVYPNSGERWNATRRGWFGEFDRREFVRLAKVWASRGAWAIGGCCRVGPATIRELAAALT